MNAEDVWNAIVDLISSMDYPSGDSEKDEAFLLFQFHSTMGSGGHESFLNLFEEELDKLGPTVFSISLGKDWSISAALSMRKSRRNTACRCGRAMKRLKTAA